MTSGYDKLGGALAAAHRDVLSRAAERLERAADVDTQLAEHLTRAGQAHASGGSAATDLRSGAEEVPSQLSTWRELPVTELAGLVALRNRAAGMQQLLAEHTSEAARATDDIVSLRYPP